MVLEQTIREHNIKKRKLEVQGIVITKLYYCVLDQSVCNDLADYFSIYLTFRQCKTANIDITFLLLASSFDIFARNSH